MLGRSPLEAGLLGFAVIGFVIATGCGLVAFVLTFWGNTTAMLYRMGASTFVGAALCLVASWIVRGLMGGFGGVGGAKAR